jgi:dTDP-4-amino-4,6-dideoxygalactose transaminase
MISLFKVYMNPEVDEPLLKVLHSGWIGQGEKVKEFENEISKIVNNKFCLSLSCGTHGLHLALRLLGVESGDEVITTPLTCTATNWPILMQNARIVWADINPYTLNIDASEIESKITDRTKAIFVVHWGGYPCDLDVIRNVAGDIPIVEDAAHAFGSTYKETIIGDCTYSNFVMFSFQ